jgi:hypothetical protein
MQNLTTILAANVRAALVKLRGRPGKQGGQKVIVHIDHNWQAAFIELPPETIQVRRQQ